MPNQDNKIKDGTVEGQKGQKPELENKEKPVVQPIEYPPSDNLELMKNFIEKHPEELKLELLTYYLTDGQKNIVFRIRDSNKAAVINYLINKLEENKILIFNKAKFDVKDALALAIEVDRTTGYLIIKRLQKYCKMIPKANVNPYFNDRNAYVEHANKKILNKDEIKKSEIATYK